MGIFFRVKKGEIDKAINRLYNAYRQGLLREERRILGPFGTTVFSSDMAYLVMLFSGLYGIPNNCKCDRKSVSINTATVYAANLDIILSYLALKYKFPKRNFPILRRAYKISSMYYSKKSETLQELIREYREAKDDINMDPESIASIFGNILSEIFLWKEDEHKENLRNMGYYLGKYYFYQTSYRKLRRNEKRGKYNPLMFIKKNDPESFEIYIRQMLKTQLKAGMEALNSLPIRENSTIIQSALYAGICKGNNIKPEEL